MAQNETVYTITLLLVSTCTLNCRAQQYVKGTNGLERIIREKYAIRIFQTSEIDPRGLQPVTLHCLLCNKSIEMNLLSSKTQQRFSVFGTCFDVSNIIISHYEYTVKIYKIVGI